MAFLVTQGDQIRRREAMEMLLSDFLHNDATDISSVLRIAIEVTSSFKISFHV